jgi:cell division protein FtsB
MAETIGSLTDKITILELKRYYMRQQILRQDVDERHRQQCEQKLQVLTDQRDDLVAEIDQLAHDVFSGRKLLKVYRQYKMYNDPQYRFPSQ